MKRGNNEKLAGKAILGGALGAIIAMVKVCFLAIKQRQNRQEAKKTIENKKRLGY